MPIPCLFDAHHVDLVGTCFQMPLPTFPLPPLSNVTDPTCTCEIQKYFSKKKKYFMCLSLLLKRNKCQNTLKHSWFDLEDCSNNTSSITELNTQLKLTSRLLCKTSGAERGNRKTMNPAPTNGGELFPNVRIRNEGYMFISLALLLVPTHETLA